MSASASGPFIATPALFTSNAIEASSRNRRSTRNLSSRSDRSARRISTLTPWVAKSIRQGFQALPVARHQQQVVATAGQVLGVGRADSGRGAGDQGDAIANLFVHVGSRWKKPDR